MLYTHQYTPDNQPAAKQVIPSTEKKLEYKPYYSFTTSETWVQPDSDKGGHLGIAHHSAYKTVMCFAARMLQRFQGDKEN